MSDSKERAFLIEGIVAGGLTTIGLLFGAGPLSALTATMVDVGVDWASSLTERAFHRWTDGWFSARGILHPDICYPLERTLDEALRQLEEDWQQHGQYWKLFSTNKEAARDTIAALKRLRFEATDKLKLEEILQILSDDGSSVLKLRDPASVRSAVRQYIAEYLRDEDTVLVEFIQQRLMEEWKYRFGKLLQESGEEGARAWRCCQRLWQQSLAEELVKLQETSSKISITVEQIHGAVSRLQEWSERLQSLPVDVREPTGATALTAITVELEGKLADLKAGLDRIERTSADIKHDTEQLGHRAVRVEVLLNELLDRVQPSPPADGQTAESSGGLPPCPYPGMEPFKAETSRFFYGRSVEIKELLQRLRYQRFLLLIGNSGSGKSSLIAAGLLPRLAQSSYWEPDTWHTVVTRPSAQSAPEIASLLRGLTTAQANEAVAAILKAKRPATRLLLVIDQVEELFAQPDRHEQRRYIEAIQALRTVNSCTLLLNLRADFYPELLNSEMKELPNNCRFELRPLDSNALRLAIRQPAADVGVRIDPALVERLVADAENEPGSLPLLQETLFLLWPEMENREITLQAYEKLRGDAPSGLAVAIARKAQQTYDALSPEGQTLARRVCLRLVQFGEGHRDIRRQQTLEELQTASVDSAALAQVVATLSNNRLLTLGDDARGRVRTADLAHEALIDGWPAFHEWIDARRAAERTRRRLESKGEEWVHLGRGQGGLLDVYELAEAEHWLDSPDAAELGYSNTLEELVHESKNAIERARSRELEIERQKTEMQAVANRRLRAVFLVSMLAIGILLVAAIQWQRADQQARTIRTQHAQAIAGRAVTEVDRDPELAVLLAMQAVSATVEHGEPVIPQAEDALHQVLTRWSGTIIRGHQNNVNSVVFSPNGRQLLTASSDGTACIWDAESGGRLLTLAEPNQASNVPVGVRTAFYSPDEDRIVTAHDDGRVRIWDARTGKMLRSIAGHQGVVLSATFSRDGKQVVSGSADHTARIWDSDTGEQLALLQGPLTRSGSPGNVWFATYSPDGQRLVLGGDYAEVWDLQAKRIAFTLDKDNPVGILRALYSPDGTFIATGDAAGEVKLWDSRTGKLIRKLTGHDNQVWGLAVSSDSQRVVSASWDHTAKVWDVGSGQLLFTLTGHRGQVLGVELSPEGKRIVTAGDDKVVVVRSLGWAEELPTLRSAGDDPGSASLAKLNDAAYSSDARRVVLAGSDGTITILDTESRKPVMPPMRPHTGEIITAKFSPDDALIVTTHADSSAQIWDANTGTVRHFLHGHDSVVDAAAFSPDGNYLVTTSWDATVNLWNTETGQLLMPLEGHERGVVDVAYSSDGTLIATSSWDKTIRLWDAATGQQVRMLSSPSKMLSVAFSPDGHLLAGGSEDGTIRIWNGNTFQLLSILPGHIGETRSLAYSPESTYLVSAGTDGAAMIWDVRTFELRAVLRGHIGAVSSAEYSEDGTRILTAGRDGTARQYLTRLSDLMSLASTRVNRGLTSEERITYLVKTDD